MELPDYIRFPKADAERILQGLVVMITTSVKTLGWVAENIDDEPDYAKEQCAELSALLQKHSQKLLGKYAVEAPLPSPKPNPDKPIICVAHRQLKRASKERPLWSECLKCRDGYMMVPRNCRTLELEPDDNCISCGQRYRYIDINDLKEMWG